MQLESKSSAVGGSKHSSGTRKAMLLETQIIALAFAQHSCVSCAALLRIKRHSLIEFRQ